MTHLQGGGKCRPKMQGAALYNMQRVRDLSCCDSSCSGFVCAYATATCETAVAWHMMTCPPGTGTTPSSVTLARGRLQRSPEELNTCIAQRTPAGIRGPAVDRGSRQAGEHSVLSISDAAARMCYGPQGRQAGVRSDAHKEESCAHTETRFARLLVGERLLGFVPA